MLVFIVGINNLFKYIKDGASYGNSAWIEENPVDRSQSIERKIHDPKQAPASRASVGLARSTRARGLSVVCLILQLVIISFFFITINFPLN